MSRFHHINQAQYIDGLRRFMNEPKAGFLVRAGFVEEGKQATGRVKGGYCEQALERLEQRVNEKSRYANAEPEQSDLGTRIALARDYSSMTNADIAKGMGASREMVRRWIANLNRPAIKRLPEMAEFLSVPVDWLEYGTSDDLPANSHLGLLVGKANEKSRETLFVLTERVVQELFASEFEPYIVNRSNEDFVRLYIEHEVFNRADMAVLARAAGGRWQMLNGRLFFAPWEPMAMPERTRQQWTDEVEKLISKLLNTSHSVYAAWNELAKRCEKLGYTKDQFPKRITLHKRMERERFLIEKYGIDMNDLVMKSVDEFLLKAA